MATQATSQGGTKRKRTKNTSLEQFELYLNYMENDYVFRSNTINPTLDPNYLANKWEELVNELNSIGTGPSLSVEEWKKRFLDWKYATRGKYRKLKSLAIQTGRGPKSTITLSDLEERGLSVWGKVAVTGASDVTTFEGIEHVEVEVEDVTLNENIENEGQNNSEIIYIVPSTESTKQPHQLPKNEKSTKNKPLSVLAQNLIKNSQQLTKNTEDFSKILNDFVEKYHDCEQQKIKIKKQNLDLEIAKFKFLNPDFEFNL